MSEEEQFDLFCTQCGQKLTKDATFCPSCGAQVSEMTEAPANSGNSNPSYGAPLPEGHVRTSQGDLDHPDHHSSPVPHIRNILHGSDRPDYRCDEE